MQNNKKKKIISKEILWELERRAPKIGDLDFLKIPLNNIK